MKKFTIVVGGSIEDDGKAFIDAWHRAEAGQDVDERTISFESAAGLREYLAQRPDRLRRLLERLTRAE